MLQDSISKKIYIASDHAGFTLKRYLIENLEKHFSNNQPLIYSDLNSSSKKTLKNSQRIKTNKVNFEIIDLGCESEKISVDYPDFANKLCPNITGDSMGILICGSGIGISISANRHKHIRAALCFNKTTAKLARLHNNANVICLGARLIKPRLALNICKTFFSQKFEGNRHIKRLEKLG
jgi:ribose 5-phosphate isomerase B